MGSSLREEAGRWGCWKKGRGMEKGHRDLKGEDKELCALTQEGSLVRRISERRDPTS